MAITKNFDDFQLIWSGNENNAKLLVENNADVNAKGDDDRTPLHLTGMNGNRFFLAKI